MIHLATILPKAAPLIGKLASVHDPEIIAALSLAPACRPYNETIETVR